MSREARGLGPEQIEERFRANYLAYQYTFVEFFTEHLSDCARAFDGDLQEMLVLAIIGQMHLKARLDAQDGPGRRRAAKQISAQITASRIADAAGIPRETVRRKLGKLAKRGWIEQDALGPWRLVEKSGATRARQDLSDIDRRALARVASLHFRLQSLLK